MRVCVCVCVCFPKLLVDTFFLECGPEYGYQLFQEEGRLSLLLLSLQLIVSLTAVRLTQENDYCLLHDRAEISV